MFQLEKCELKLLRMQIAKLCKVKSANILALQTFLSIYPSKFSKLVIIDKNIMDDNFKELKNINTILIEKQD